MVTSHPGGRGAFIAVGSESQISVDQVTLYSSNQRNTQMSGYFFGGGSMRRSQNLETVVFQ